MYVGSLRLIPLAPQAQEWPCKANGRLIISEFYTTAPVGVTAPNILPREFY